jgi:hypothetical protein
MHHHKFEECTVKKNYLQYQHRIFIVQQLKAYSFMTQQLLTVRNCNMKWCRLQSGAALTNA